jgi:hypothetical protein
MLETPLVPEHICIFFFFKSDKNLNIKFMPDLVTIELKKSDPSKSEFNVPEQINYYSITFFVFLQYAP